jgi:hypothetical protein
MIESRDHSLPPSEGLYCNKCMMYIPVFINMSDRQVKRIKELVKCGRNHAAFDELMIITGCGPLWARIWLIHMGLPYNRSRARKSQMIDCSREMNSLMQ